MNADSRTLIEYLAIVRRRRYMALITIVIVTGLAVLVAYLTPSQYMSAGRILIESQDLPENLIGAGSGGFATRQIQLIEEVVLTDENLSALMDKHGLYGIGESITPDEREGLIERFKADVFLQLVSAPILEAGSRASQAAIAFNLGFVYHEAITAQLVADDLVNAFLDVNRDRRLQRSNRVSEFLERAVAEAQAELREQETLFAQFKAENEGALPTQLASNVVGLERAEEERERTIQRIQEVERRIVQLNAQLIGVYPELPAGMSNEATFVSESERLRALRSEFVRKSGIYKPGHPDLVRLAREIDLLEANVPSTASLEELNAALSREKAALEELEAKYGPEHPDILRTEATIRQIESNIATTESGVEPEIQATIVNNPAYILLRGELQTAESELGNLRRRQQDLIRKMDRYSSSLARGPSVEIEYEALARAVGTAAENLADLEYRLNSAEVIADVEDELSMIRFTLIRRPSVPRSAIGPNRPGIVFFGLVLALGLAAFIVALVEALDDTVWGEKSVRDITGSPPLVTV